MLRKSFISLVFTKNALQAVKLAASQKKVEKFVTVDLPQGLIIRHKVQDVDALSNILKNIWKKFNLRERGVGIVVPEFSTYTKTLTLPKLSLDDLHEAILWQAQDFLPLDASDMVLDWQIIKTDEKNYHIFAVAIEKEVLSGYVEAVNKAGLLPAVVEIPSLSLVRLAQNDPSGKVIIYFNNEDALFVLSEGSRVLATSVIASSDIKSLILTVSRLINHFSDVSTKKIILGGEVNQSTADELSANLKLPYEVINTKVAGMTSQEIQKYLIPISLQFRNPSDPSDTQSINLLPVEVVKKYETKRLSFQVWTLMMISTFIVTCILLISVGSYLYFIQQINNIKNSQDYSSLEPAIKGQEIRATVKSINTTSDKILKIAKNSYSPQEILNLIYTDKPEGVTLFEYKIDLDRGQGIVQGIASNRVNLLTFKENMEKNEKFSQVTLPISSYEAVADLEFEMSFFYTPISMQSLGRN